MTFSRYFRDRRRAQSGTTLVELLVSLTIASLALALIIGTLSTGLLEAVHVKRNVGVQAVLQYEMEQVTASQFSASASPYSDCFATESASNPVPATGFQGACSPGYTLRADVTCQLTCSSSLQTWTVVVAAWPSGGQTGWSVQFYKTAHQ